MDGKFCQILSNLPFLLLRAFLNISEISEYMYTKFVEGFQKSETLDTLYRFSWMPPPLETFVWNFGDLWQLTCTNYLLCNEV